MACCGLWLRHCRRDVRGLRRKHSLTNASQDERFGHVYRRDAYLVFRSICKLALKDLPDRELLDKNSHDLRSKILSLDVCPPRVFPVAPFLSRSLALALHLWSPDRALRYLFCV